MIFLNNIKQIIDQCVTKDFVRDLYKRKYDGVHISELGCDREYMFKVLGYRAIPDPESIRVFGSGIMWHEYLQNTLVRNGWIPESAIEEKLKSQLYNLDSSIDVSFIIINNEIYLLDFKTARCQKHPKDKFGFEGLLDVDDKHKRQVILYMHFLNEKLKKEPIVWKNTIINKITKAIVVYIRKDGGTWKKDEIPDWAFDDDFYKELQAMTEFKLVFKPRKRNEDIKWFVVPYDPIVAKIYIKQIEKLNELIKAQELPPANYDDQWYCNNFCDFPELCKEFK